MGRLDEIEGRLRAATPGPWSRPMEAPFDGVMVISQAADKNVAGVVWPDADATFIAHSREDVEWLVARVRELEGAVRDAACCPFSGCAACVVRLRAALADRLVKGESEE